MKKILLSILGLLFLIFVFGQEAFGQNNEVVVTSFPDGAAIVVDGVDTGKITPAELHGINPGKHIVTVSVPDWQSTTTTANILDKDKDGKDRDTHLSFSLMPVLTTGPQGATGPAGPIGAIGPQGPAGASGIGTVGAIGLQGPAGPAGPSGAAGATGAQGPEGATGNTGAPGSNGIDGAVGAIGPQGPQGIMGFSITGPAGKDGVTIVGPMGLQGIAGPAGLPGAASTIPGPAGPSGPTGTNARSAFQGVYDSTRTDYQLGDFILYTPSGQTSPKVYLYSVNAPNPAITPDIDTADWLNISASALAPIMVSPPPPPPPPAGGPGTYNVTITFNGDDQNACGPNILAATISVDVNGGLTGVMPCPNDNGICTINGVLTGISGTQSGANSTVNLLPGSGCHSVFSFVGTGSDVAGFSFSAHIIGIPNVIDDNAINITGTHQ